MGPRLGEQTSQGSIITDRLSRKERLGALYQEIRTSLGNKKTPRLIDVSLSGIDIEPMASIITVGNWLRAKKCCEGSLSAFEERLLDTEREVFLQHLEKDPNHGRFYRV